MGLWCSRRLSGEAGLIGGGGVTGMLGAGLFWGGAAGLNLGLFGGGGGFLGFPFAGTNATAPSMPGAPPFALGGYVGAVVGAFLTNATCPDDLHGPNYTVSVN